jgi:hypothetical protein
MWGSNVGSNYLILNNGHINIIHIYAAMCLLKEQTNLLFQYNSNNLSYDHPKLCVQNSFTLMNCVVIYFIVKYYFTIRGLISFYTTRRQLQQLKVLALFQSSRSDPERLDCMATCVGYVTPTFFF